MGVAQQTIGTGSGTATLATNVATTPGGNSQAMAPMSGVGAHTAVPTYGTNTVPVAIGTVPEGAVGIRMYAPPGVSFSFCTAASSGAAAAAFSAGAVKVFAQAADGPNWDENLNGMNIYVGAITGNPGTPGPTAPVASYRYI